MPKGVGYGKGKGSATRPKPSGNEVLKANDAQAERVAKRQLGTRAKPRFGGKRKGGK